MYDGDVVLVVVDTGNPPEYLEECDEREEEIGLCK